MPAAASRAICSSAPFASDAPGANARTVAFACASLAHDVLHRAVCLRLTLRERAHRRACLRLAFG